MKHVFKGAIALVMAASMCMATSLSVSAYTAHGTTTKTTDGGTNGKVTISATAFTDLYQPSGGVYVYKYGVRAKISTSSTLTTYFDVTGKVSKSTSSTPISASGTKNSVDAYTSSSVSNAYDYVQSTVDTNSSAFGSSHQECNYSL